jgi:hypothetical protein
MNANVDLASSGIPKCACVSKTFSENYCIVSEILKVEVRYGFLGVFEKPLSTHRLSHAQASFPTSHTVLSYEVNLVLYLDN